MAPPLEEDDVMKRFLTALHLGFVAFLVAGAMPAAAQDESASPAVPADAMTGAYLLRDSLVPRADDLPLIQRKPALYLSSFNDDMATVAYSLEGGRIVYRVVAGTVDGASRDAIDRALVRLQRKVAL